MKSVRFHGEICPPDLPMKSTGFHNESPPDFTEIQWISWNTVDFMMPNEPRTDGPIFLTFLSTFYMFTFCLFCYLKYYLSFPMNCDFWILPFVHNILCNQNLFQTRILCIQRPTSHLPIESQTLTIWPCNNLDLCKTLT